MWIMLIFLLWLSLWVTQTFVYIYYSSVQNLRCNDKVVEAREPDMLLKLGKSDHHNILVYIFLHFWVRCWFQKAISISSKLLSFTWGNFDMKIEWNGGNNQQKTRSMIRAWHNVWSWSLKLRDSWSRCWSCHECVKDLYLWHLDCLQRRVFYSFLHLSVRSHIWSFLLQNTLVWKNKWKKLTEYL